eukprot:3373216-Prymnesium_polylepis.1
MDPNAIPVPAYPAPPISAIAKPDIKKLSRRICKHNRQSSVCVECGGRSICEQKKRRTRCIHCGGGSLCKHRKRKDKCAVCHKGREAAVNVEAVHDLAGQMVVSQSALSQQQVMMLGMGGIAALFPSSMGAVASSLVPPPVSVTAQADEPLPLPNPPQFSNSDPVAFAQPARDWPPPVQAPP